MTREEKRRETLRRITDAGIKLFGKQGYEATTLEQIAGAAGISRRTFFHYFKSKDDILLSMQSGLGEHMLSTLAQAPAGDTPLDTMRHVLRTMVAPYRPEELIVVDRLMRSSEAVQARKQASYVRDEKLLLAALQQRWPAENAMVLRIVATVSIATVRLTLDVWSGEGGVRPIAQVLEEVFSAFDAVAR